MNNTLSRDRRMLLSDFTTATSRRTTFVVARLFTLSSLAPSITMSSPSVSPTNVAQPAYVTRAGVDVSQMDDKQAEYMQKDLCILVNRQDKAIGSSAKKDCQ